MTKTKRDSSVAMVPGAALEQAFAAILEPGAYEDYCPNGLQVEGRGQVRRLVSAVSASAAAIRRAAALRADALLVHHGLFWRGDDPRLTGLKFARVRLLIDHGIALYAYHLPLDAHPELGNNACLARVMGWPVERRAGRYGLLSVGELERGVSSEALARQLRRRLGRAPLVVGPVERPIRRLAWCTGAAQDEIEEAVALGADAYISGEISERTTHQAREAGIVYFAAGHHATERYGVRALGEAVAAQLGIWHGFVDDENPV